MYQKISLPADIVGVGFYVTCWNISNAEDIGIFPLRSSHDSSYIQVSNLHVLALLSRTTWEIPGEPQLCGKEAPVYFQLPVELGSACQEYNLLLPFKFYSLCEMLSSQSNIKTKVL